MRQSWSVWARQGHALTLLSLGLGALASSQASCSFLGLSGLRSQALP